jgi:uncharacterized phiE125 gp8 family phage protein
MNRSGLLLITAPTLNPVTDAEVWNHLRLNLSGSPAQPSTREKATADQMTAAAISYLDGRDGILGRALMPQTWELQLDRFPSPEEILLPLSPVISIDSIKYTDVDGVEQTFSASKYSLSLETNWRPRVILGYDQAWPGTRSVQEAVRVRFQAGYASGNSPEDTTGLPSTLKQALLLLIGHMFENREAVVTGLTVAELPMGIRMLLTPLTNRAI